jgi:hypothetical protein
VPGALPAPRRRIGGGVHFLGRDPRTFDLIGVALARARLRKRTRRRDRVPLGRGCGEEADTAEYFDALPVVVDRFVMHAFPQLFLSIVAAITGWLRTRLVTEASNELRHRGPLVS